MAKVYLTREQADRMKGMLEEDNATLEVDVTPKAGESIEQSVIYCCLAMLSKRSVHCGMMLSAV